MTSPGVYQSQLSLTGSKFFLFFFFFFFFFLFFLLISSTYDDFVHYSERKALLGPRNKFTILKCSLSRRLLYQKFLTLQKPRKIWDRKKKFSILRCSVYQLSLFRGSTVPSKSPSRFIVWT